MHNQIKIFVIISIVFLFTIPLLAFSTFGENWPTYMGNNFLTGNNDGISPKQFNLIWSFSKGSILYNPVPVNGKLYVVSTDQHLYCLDEKTGKLLWSFKADAPLTRMVVVYKGKIILPGGRFIYCLDENSGQLLWARRDKTFGFYGTPTIANEKVFYGNRKGFYARNINSGKLIWENKNIYTYGGFPSYWNGKVFTVSKNFNEGITYLCTLDEKSGELIWKKPIVNYSNIFSPVIFDKKLYLTAGYSLLIYNAENGSLIKEIKFKKPVYSTPIFSQNKLYFSLADGKIVKLNPQDYSYNIVFKAPVGTQFSIIGSNLYIPEKGVLNDIAVVDASRGIIIKRVSIPEGEPFTFTIADSKLFVPASRKLYAIGEGGIEIASGKVLNRFKKEKLPPASQSATTEKAKENKEEFKNTKLTEKSQPSTLPEHIQTTKIQGKVYDEETKELIPSGNITATTKLKNGKVLLNESKINKGEFSIEVPKQGKTDLIISSAGYIFKNIVLPDEKAINDLSTESLDISLPRIKTGKKFSIESIYFDTGSANLTKESLPTLNKLLKIMDENPNIKIEIYGHTDSTGSKSFNIKLSLMRANAIKYWLVMNGISEYRITTKGFGDTKPIADNSTPNGRRKNRRVEIKIIK